MGRVYNLRRAMVQGILYAFISILLGSVVTFFLIQFFQVESPIGTLALTAFIYFIFFVLAWIGALLLVQN